MEVRFYAPGTPIPRCSYAIIAASHRGRWLLVRHRERTTWELPAGHVEPGESPEEAAHRELREETGASRYRLHPVCPYGVEEAGEAGYGMLFYAEVEAMDGGLEHEIGETGLFDRLPQAMTYARIPPVMLTEVVRWMRGKGLEIPGGGKDGL
ncbi:NUDIX hydrolase [Anaerotalea alkaliphila]|uniref:NUDIX domain-containing protein n=1 Tax=Anaerotalea alkaliphila TaxID=2662126 RepID=A0A7X5HTP4_9FIRM|nr:NUDIX domain-containing protein [Anaerotalea alkaliphila]NDL66480.1 NUDIX domain-containing protein [Anaerotalea alkaliphila]